MAIIYSYPRIDEVQGSDLILVADASKRNQTKSASVNQLFSDILNGDNRYIPRFSITNDGTKLVNSVIYQDTDGHIGINVQPDPEHVLEVFDDRTGDPSGQHSIYLTTYAGATPGSGAGGILARVSEDSGATFNSIAMVPGTSSSDWMTSNQTSFYANSNLDTSSATGYSGKITHDGTDTHWILGGVFNDTTTATLKVNGELLINTPESGYAIKLAENDGTEKFEIGVDSAGDLNIYNSETLVIEIKNVTNEVRFLNGANIEVQSTAPVIKAQVDNDNSARIQAQGTTGGQLLLEHEEDVNVLFQANGNNGVVGTMGVGTTNPDNTYKLDVRGDIRTTGGIFIGGVTAGNKLDDYEEGEFTPNLTTSGTEPGITTKEGRYTKIGDTVFVEIRIRDFVSEDESNSVTGCTNLPFTVLDTLSSTYVTGSAFGTHYADNSTYAGRQYVYALDNTTVLTFRNGDLVGIGFESDTTTEVSASIIYKTA